MTNDNNLNDLSMLVKDLRTNIIDVLKKYRHTVPVPHAITALGMEFGRLAYLASDTEQNTNAEIVATHAIGFIATCCEAINVINPDVSADELRRSVIALMPAKLEELHNA